MKKLNKKSIAILLAVAMLSGCSPINITINQSDNDTATTAPSAPATVEDEAQGTEAQGKKTQKKKTQKTDTKTVENKDSQETDLYAGQTRFGCDETDGGLKNVILGFKFIEGTGDNYGYRVSIEGTTVDCYYAEQYEGYNGFLSHDAEDCSDIIITISSDENEMAFCSSGWYGRYNGVYNKISSQYRDTDNTSKKKTDSKKTGYTGWYSSCLTGDNNGIKSFKISGNQLTIEGFLGKGDTEQNSLDTYNSERGSTHTTYTFTLADDCIFTERGGIGSYEESKSEFVQIIQDCIGGGLGFFLRMKQGEVVEIGICS